MDWTTAQVMLSDASCRVLASLCHCLHPSHQLAPAGTRYDLPPGRYSASSSAPSHQSPKSTRCRSQIRLNVEPSMYPSPSHNPESQQSRNLPINTLAIGITGISYFYFNLFICLTDYSPTLLQGSPRTVVLDPIDPTLRP